MNTPRRLAQKLKQHYRRAAFRHAVVVAGLGRCGTTLVQQSLLTYGLRRDRLFLDHFEDVAQYPNGYVYKTHSLPPPSLPNNVKLIFMFGNPMNIAISAHNRMNRWGRKHHKHMGSDLYVDNDCVFQRDTLLLHEHFDLWYRPQRFSFVSVKYEALYEQETLNTLNDFLGRKLALPPFKKRTSDWINHPRKEKLLELYADLHKRIEEAENIKIWDAKSGKMPDR